MLGMPISSSGTPGGVEVAGDRHLFFDRERDPRRLLAVAEGRVIQHDVDAVPWLQLL